MTNMRNTLQSKQRPINKLEEKLFPRKYGIGGQIYDAIKAIAKTVEGPLQYLNYTSPTAVAGAIGRKVMGNTKPLNDLILEGTGVVSTNFAQSHPIAAIAINLGLDMAGNPLSLFKNTSKFTRMFNAIEKTTTSIVDKSQLVKGLTKLATSNKITPERQRLWKALMYISNGRPSHGMQLAKDRLSSEELTHLMHYVKTGDASALTNVKPGYIGFIRKGDKSEDWLERYTTYIDPTKIDLLDLTLMTQSSTADIPKLYKQLSKSAPILTKKQAIDILGGKIIGTKSAITNREILGLLEGQNVPKGITPIVSDTYESGVKAIERLNTEKPILSYSLNVNQIKSAKKGEEGMFNTAGMHNYVYLDENGKFRLVEVDVFKNSIGDIKKKYADVGQEVTNFKQKVKDVGIQHMFKKYNNAEQTAVLIVREKNVTADDILKALAMQQTKIAEGRAALREGKITEKQYRVIRQNVKETESKLEDILRSINPKWYIDNATKVNYTQKQLLGKPDKLGHFYTDSDLHRESVVDKILNTQNSRKTPQIIESTDRNRIRKIIDKASERGEQDALTEKAIITSLEHTPETLNPTLKQMYKIVKPKKYDQAMLKRRTIEFSRSPQDNIELLFNTKNKTYIPQAFNYDNKGINAQINNTIYILQNYSLNNPSIRQETIRAIDNGYTLFEPSILNNTETFYNTIKECKRLYVDKLEEILPVVDKSMQPYLRRALKKTKTLPDTI